MGPRDSARWLAISLVLACALAPARRADAYSWQQIGPRGGGALLVDVDANPETLYAASSRKVFRSDDGGATWTPILTFTQYVLGMGVDPTAPGTLYAVTGSQDYCGLNCVEVTIAIARSTNGGGSWSQLYYESAQNGYPGGMYLDRVDVAVDPTVPQTIHAGGWVRSVDGGANWTPVTGLTAGASAMVVDPGNAQIVYAGVEYYSGNGVFKSTDAGQTFVEVGNFSVSDLSRDPADGVLYIATSGGVYRSADAGASWTPTAALPEPAAAAVAARDGIVWAGTRGSKAPNPLVAGSVYRSANGGATWTERASGVPHLPVLGTSIRAVVLHPTSSVAWVGTDNFGVFRTDSDGVAWQSAHNGFDSLGIERMVYDPTPPGTLYAGTELGLYRSRNRGASWTPASDGFGGPAADPIAIQPGNPSTLFAVAESTPAYFASAGLFKSSDAGTTWTDNNANLGIGRVDIGALAFDPVTPSTLYLVHTVTGVSKSTDGGASFTNTSIPSFSADQLVIDPDTPSTLYAAGSQYGVFKSVDAGANWTQANTGLADTRIHFLAMDPTDPQRLYARSGNTVLVTTADGAASWTTMAPVTFTPQSFAVNPVTSAVYLGGGGGNVVESPPGGTSWTPLGGLVGFNVVRTLVVDPAATIVFAGGYAFTGGGVAWLQLTACTTAADCDDGNDCTTDSCDVPTGTCTYATLADGAPCDDGDACTDDVCTGGACRSTYDGCNVCVNPADVDGDGLNDACDLHDGVVTLRTAKVTQHPTRASVTLKGNVLLNAPPDVVSPATGITLAVSTGSGPVTTVSWPPVECPVRSPGRFACTNATRLAKLKVTPSGKSPGAPRFTAKVRGLSIASVPAAPIAVTITETGAQIDRVGEIATCTPKTSALVCRAP